MSTNDRPFLTRPLVIDWLQYNAFPEKLGELDYPQITLSLIEEYRTAIATQAAKIRELDDELKYHKKRYNQSKRLEALDSENKRLRTALKYYANNSIYDTWLEDHPSGNEVIAMECDRGDRAQKALNQPQAGEKGENE